MQAQTLNHVDEASRESFPASDAPAAGGMSRVGTPPRDASYASVPSTRWGDGLVAALLGFAAIAGTFAAADISAGRSPFYTVAVLGSVLVFGAADAADVRVAPLPVIAYTIAHLLVFILFGVVGAWLVAAAERRSRRWFIALLFFMLVAFHLTAAAQALAAPVQAALPAAAVWLAGITGGVLMAGYLVWSRPRLRA